MLFTLQADALKCIVLNKIETNKLNDEKSKELEIKKNSPLLFQGEENLNYFTKINFNILNFVIQQRITPRILFV